MQKVMSDIRDFLQDMNKAAPDVAEFKHNNIYALLLAEGRSTITVSHLQTPNVATSYASLR